MTNSIHRLLASGTLCLFLVAIVGCGREDRPTTETAKKAKEQNAPPAERTKTPTGTVKPAKEPIPPVQPADKKVKEPDKTKAVPKVPAETPTKPKEPSFEEKVGNSTPLDLNPTPVEAGGKTIKAEPFVIEGKEFLDENSMRIFRAIEVVGDKLMVIDDKGNLHGFTIEDGEAPRLTVDASFGDQGVLTLDNQVQRLSRGESGTVIASGFVNAYVIKDGKREYDCRAGGVVEMHSSGKWGIATAGNLVRLVNFADSSCTFEDLELESPNQADPSERLFGYVNSAAVIGDQIIIGGTVSVEGERKIAHMVVALDKDGSEGFRFGNPADPFAEDGFGYIHAVDSCSTGICVLDSNLRRITLLSSDGKLVASVKVNDLFDLRYPWLPDFTVAEDGTAYFVAGQDREGGGVAQGVIYRVTGL